MVAIPSISDPTLEAMRRTYEVIGNQEKKRDYIGASTIGNPCSRQIWYDYKQYPREPFKAETLFNFEDGHHVESLMANRLRMVSGVELWTHDENGNQFERTAFGGKFKAHPDGVILGILQAPKSPHIWENKASGHKKFTEFQSCKVKFGDKSALKNWNENYFAQAQVLMHLFQINRHYMTVALAGGREIDSCRTEYQAEVAEKYLERAGKLLDAKETPPRISDKSDFFVCKMCSFRDECHGKGY